MTSNEYTVKDSFTFTEEIVEQDSVFFIGSLDADPVFTNIPLEETIDICADTLFENTKTVEGLSEIEFKECLSLATKKSYFIFNGKFYKQVDKVDMGSPFWVRHWPMLLYFEMLLCLYTLKRIGYEIVRIC